MDEINFVAIGNRTWLFLDEDSRIVGFSYCDPSTYDDPLSEGHTVVEVDDATFQAIEHDPLEYLYVNGSFEWNPTPEQARRDAFENAPDAVDVLKAVFESQPDVLKAIPDETLSTMGYYMQPWEVGKDYAVGDLREYQFKPYRCLQAHTSIQEWNPASAVSLWARVLAGGDTIPVWEQPESTNPYMKGDKVHFPTASDPVYVSTIDYNVYAPNVYGWELM